MTTENRNYNLPQAGEADWHVPVNENWQMIDADIQEVFDTVQAAMDALESNGG